MLEVACNKVDSRSQKLFRTCSVVTSLVTSLWLFQLCRANSIVYSRYEEKPHFVRFSLISDIILASSFAFSSPNELSTFNSLTSRLLLSSLSFAFLTRFYEAHEMLDLPLAQQIYNHLAVIWTYAFLCISVNL